MRKELAAVSLGGMIGSGARYGLGVLWPHPPRGFPWATLVTNVSGCLLIGVLMVLIAERPLLRPFLGVGVLGGYTTFSTYVVDVQVSRPGVGLAYLAATLVGALLAVWAGAEAGTVAGARLAARRAR